MALIRKQDTASLLSNGHFSSSLFDWSFTGDARQIIYEQNNSGTHTPQFAASIPAGAKIWQNISRSDTYSYPSRHLVTRVVGTPVGINTINLKAVPTTNNTGSVFDPPVEEARRNFNEIEPGSQIIIRDLNFPERSESYRAGRPNTDGTISASPLMNDMWRLAEDSDYLGATVTNVTSNSARLTVTGLYKPDRGNGVEGIRPLDVFVFTSPEFFVAQVDSITTTVDGFVFGVKRVNNAAFFSADTIVDKWFVSPSRSFNVFYDAPLFRYEYTLALSIQDSTVIPIPKLELFPIVDNAVLTGVAGDGDPINIPAVKLNNNLYVERVTSAKNSTLPTPFGRFIYRFTLERSTPVFGSLRLTIEAPTDKSIVIGSVVLYKGNYTNRHDYDDRDADSGPGQLGLTGLPIVETNADPANQLDAIDRLLHGAEESNVIPKGTTVLHLGSSCPPGFKRVDSFANSPVDGLGRSLPKPNSVYYDAVRDRTVMTWTDKVFDLLDSNNKPIPIESDQQEINFQVPSAVLPFSASSFQEIVKYGPNQPWIQPGMSIRIRTSDVQSGSGRQLDYSALVRQIAVKKEHVTSPRSDGQTSKYFSGPYPYYLASSNFSAGEEGFPPAGPWYADQPGGAGFNVTPVQGFLAVGLSTTLSDGDETMRLNSVNITDASINRLLFVRWTTATASVNGNFIAQIKYALPIGPDIYNLTLVRYDGNPMVVNPTATAQSRTVQATVSLSEAQIFDPRAVVTRLDKPYSSGSPYRVLWSVRLFSTMTTISVNGNVASDISDYNTDLTVEPTGFLKFGEPEFSYGSMGHSHEIIQGDAPFNTNIAPHVTGNYYTNPRTEVARKHGHGFMPRHVYPMPEFVAYLLCEKI